MIGFFSQFYLRKYKADWFIKYNYIVSAGMDGECFFSPCEFEVWVDGKSV